MTSVPGWLAALLLPLGAAALELADGVLELLEARHGPAAVERVRAWQELAGDAADLPVTERLELVNRFFNQVRFVSDAEHWGREDYWASPVELLATDGGDCEDYSIAKYFTLRFLGVPDERLRITYVKALDLNQAHMVLTYQPPDADEPWVLDNLIPEIRPASQRPDLVPVYTFNGESLWLAVERGRGSRHAGSAQRMERWRILTGRVASELAAVPGDGAPP